jgi:hypothetical protein
VRLFNEGNGCHLQHICCVCVGATAANEYDSFVGVPADIVR